MKFFIKECKGFLIALLKEFSILLDSIVGARPQSVIIRNFSNAEPAQKNGAGLHLPL